MTAMTQSVRTASIRIPAWLMQAVLILALGLAVLALREAGVLPPDVTLPLGPLAPGAPDLVGRMMV